ncbi:MAG TPA: ankyrin repeat domain-containing protein [Patescibacteria group bacterium]|nr:ankyrin repeat domain-containing protein [Patescibacteria group bacterium]
MRGIGMRCLGIWALCVLSTGCGMPPADTPLTSAVEKADATGVKDLLAQGADPGETDSHGLTALIRAARRGDVAVTRVLLQGGASVDQRDSFVNGWTALMHATHTGRIEIMRDLLDAGADVNASNRHGVTALLLASGDQSDAIVRLLLDRGADPHLRAASGASPLTNAVANGRSDQVKALLERAPDLRLDDSLADSVALLMARARGKGDILAKVSPRTP